MLINKIPISDIITLCFLVPECFTSNFPAVLTKKVSPGTIILFSFQNATFSFTRLTPSHGVCKNNLVGTTKLFLGASRYHKTKSAQRLAGLLWPSG